MPSAIFVVAQESFRDEELLVPRDELEQAGWTCSIASRERGICTGMRGGRVNATLSLDEVRVADCDAVVFVGGNGARTLFEDPEAHRIARECDAAGKILAAICIAPGILARAGVVRGRRMTCFASEAKALAASGARVDSASVVIDGNLVTADGPRVANEFAVAILHAAMPRAARITQSLRAVRRAESR